VRDLDILLIEGSSLRQGTAVRAYWLLYVYQYFGELVLLYAFRQSSKIHSDP